MQYNIDLLNLSYHRHIAVNRRMRYETENVEKIVCIRISIYLFVEFKKQFVIPS